MIEMKVGCANRKEALCPSDCPIYKISERMAIAVVTQFPDEYSMGANHSVASLASRIGITDEEIEIAENNCTLDARERTQNPRNLN
jgi:hypothetical protein